MTTVLAIPDIHAPFAHRRALHHVLRVAAKVKPNEVVFLGDEIDSHAVSSYVPDPDGRSPGDELKAAVRALRPWYREFPKAKVCVSNHTYRPWKKAKLAGIPSRVLRSYGEVLDAPSGWAWADEWKIDGVTYTHGEGLSGDNATRKAAVLYGTSVVFGHLHSVAGIEWVHQPSRSMFGFAVGCLIDRRAYAFGYSKYSTKLPLLGCGVIENGVPRWYPLKWR